MLSDSDINLHKPSQNPVIGGLRCSNREHGVPAQIQQKFLKLVFLATGHFFFLKISILTKQQM